MTLGFTGTSYGMTQQQRVTVRWLLQKLNVTELHHGDCIGADVQIDIDIYLLTAARVTVHPPTDFKKRAFCHGNRSTVCEAKPYLKRNWSIVYAGVDGLIAAPKDFVEPKNKRNQGTWTTVSYARRAKRHIWIVLPDGTLREEC